MILDFIFLTKIMIFGGENWRKVCIKAKNGLAFPRSAGYNPGS